MLPFLRFLFRFLVSTRHRKSMQSCTVTKLPFRTTVYVVSYQPYDRLTFCFRPYGDIREYQPLWRSISGSVHSTAAILRRVHYHSPDVAVHVVSVWSSISISLNWTRALVLSMFMPCNRTCVGVRWCMTLYHVDLVSSDIGVEAMLSQIAPTSAFVYLTTIRVKGKSCPKSGRCACSPGPSQRRKRRLKGCSRYPAEKQ
jgi:hypothetical protein